MVTNNERTDERKGGEADKTTANSQNMSDGGLWGSDMYPERRGPVVDRGWFNTFNAISTLRAIDKNKCEQNVYSCIKDSPIVKLMLGALKSSGCEIDIRRHISCEICDPSVTGGYDTELNQIVVCQNTVSSAGKVQGILLHEMIHMFDYCRNKMDMKNIDHLACTEIRASNIGHCSFMSSIVHGESSFFNIKETHQNCVKYRARLSIMGVHKVSEEVANAAIERVFTKCYNDLEPVGRRIRRNSEDMPRAYAESFLYGYSA